MRGGFENGLFRVLCGDSPNSTSITALGLALELTMFADREESRLAVVALSCPP